MRYLLAEDILLIHQQLIAQTGGMSGVKDANLLLHLVEKPASAFGGTDVYTTLHSKAAAYWQGFARGHVFNDGNKRTAFALAARFLAINGYRLDIDNQEAEAFSLSVVVERLEVEEISVWLERRANKQT